MFSRRSDSANRAGEDSLRAPSGKLQNIGERCNVHEILSIPVPFSPLGGWSGSLQLLIPGPTHRDNYPIVPI
jgi:hypothetical protein